MNFICAKIIRRENHLKNIINFFELCKCFEMKLMKNCTIKDLSTVRNQILFFVIESGLLKTTVMPESIHDIGTPYGKSTTFFHSPFPLSVTSN